jgi:hypothetical protein
VLADFTGTADSAFTLMTPLYDMQHLPASHLLGRGGPAAAGKTKTGGGQVKQYRYQFGEVPDVDALTNDNTLFFAFQRCPSVALDLTPTLVA